MTLNSQNQARAGKAVGEYAKMLARLNVRSASAGAPPTTVGGGVVVDIATVVPPSQSTGGGNGGSGNNPNNSGGNSNNHGDRKMKKFEIPLFLKIALIALAASGFMHLTNYLSRQRDLDHLDYLAKKAAIPVVNHEQGQQPQKSLPKDSVTLAVTFDCKQGDGSHQVQTFSSAFGAGSGCMLVEASFLVNRVEGKNFVIEVPTRDNPATSYKCVVAAECARFLNTLNSAQEFPDKRFRVIVQNGGFINIS